ncbi:MAG: carboxypeptidase-like regulatory domain-containing protein [bacterium]
MARLVFFFLSFSALALTLCGMGRREPRPSPLAAIEQGVAGKVEIWEGNFMPMVGGSPSGKITPAPGRRVRIHEPFNSREFGKFDALQDTIPMPLVAETRTDSSGEFFMSLPVGTYSIFVEEDGKWYFNGWDGEGFQGLVRVDSSTVTQQNIRITIRAVF